MAFLDKVTEDIDARNCVDVIAKAFDKVPHQRLLNCIKSHSIKGKLWNWISAWLTGRRQGVYSGARVNITDKLTVMSGVHQGSVLGELTSGS